VRVDVTFPSGDGACAAWLYRPAAAAGPVPCVVMGHGFSLTRHDALGAYASVLADAGYAVLVFDYRGFGDSPGEPRQRFRLRMQREDWRSAIAHARTLDGVDRDRIALWGYSMGCSSAVTVAAQDAEGIAAVLTLCPFVDGLARVLDMSGALGWSPEVLRSPAADAEALRGDWQRVGADLWRAVERVRPEVEAARRASRNAA